MASTILYKFRSATTFEALPLPGSAARLFDVKKAIVKAKKLDSGSIEFDLAVRNADTNEEYANEAMLLPRGTRLIVQRLPAQRGHGFLARMARNEHAGTGMPSQHMPPGAAPSGYYTIESRAGDADEFVSTTNDPANDEKELAALQAATNLQSDGPAMTGGYATQKRSYNAGAAGASTGGGGQKPNFAKAPNFRPNADPELRDQEKKMMPKKGRATGIPRTFLSLSAPPQTDGSEGGDNESSMPMLQPNSQGFKDLVNRGGGRSENTAGTRRDLDYALKLTATTVPEHLQCGICHNVVKNAMLLPWDPEGRTTCETCIRDGLTQNGFRCPLTGMDGVSPDDLLPNVGLRKAVEMFIKGVMDKVDEIEQEQVEEADVTTDAARSTDADGNILDGAGTEKGVIVSKKSNLVNRKKSEEVDPFGGDDDFGGDVFAVDLEQNNAVEEAEEGKGDAKETQASKDQTAAKKGDEKASETKEADSTKVDKDETQPKSIPDRTLKRNGKDSTPSAETQKDDGGSTTPQKQTRQADVTQTQNRRERRRGPPVGYAMGPAGASRDNRDQGSDHGHDGGRGGRGGGRFQNYQGRGGNRGRGHRGGRGSYDNNNRGGGYGDGADNAQDDDRNHGTKRSWSDDHSDENRYKQHRHERQDDRDRHRGDSHDGRSYHNEGGDHHRGGYRGRGRSRGRGGGGFRGGRGRRY